MSRAPPALALIALCQFHQLRQRRGALKTMAAQLVEARAEADSTMSAKSTFLST